MNSKNLCYIDETLISSELVPKTIAKLNDLAITQVGIVTSYANRTLSLPDSTDSISFFKVLIVSKSKDAQNYAKLKKGATTAGAVEAVFYKPDFSSKTVELEIRAVCEKGWADSIIDLELSPEKDGLHKKKHYFTQVEAKYLFENNISLIFDKRNLVSTRAAIPFNLNRINQIKHVAENYAVKLFVISIASDISQIEHSRPLSHILEGF